jgi:hypothetical protein
MDFLFQTGDRIRVRSPNDPSIDGLSGTVIDFDDSLWPDHPYIIRIDGMGPRFACSENNLTFLLDQRQPVEECDYEEEEV